MTRPHSKWSSQEVFSKQALDGSEQKPIANPEPCSPTWPERGPMRHNARRGGGEPHP